MAKKPEVQRGVSPKHEQRTKELQKQGLSRSAAATQAFRQLANEQGKGGNG
jgi:hypothetical protein